MLNAAYIEKCEGWLAERFEDLTDKIVLLEPSEWAEHREFARMGWAPFGEFLRASATSDAPS